MDTPQRTLLKAILWNLLGLVTMSLVGLAMTGSALLGGGMAILNTVIGVTCYIAYERVWNAVAWGRHGQN
ncbi:DUF2061 domain-containing protein [Aliigemmobacter aestuarii]|uniref:DUF2061 domain-containing protein n=1 Tax=Aliigemmobacter aestuarii TaxID=1445661 RepID=A0A4S3MS85_9RHOB|nr:DUF2061 domain-containing protein [Gemmobacter aestuarii]THD84705.1 DUF2061 domain-containing protein [Gemmobacter aestuarii]